MKASAEASLALSEVGTNRRDLAIAQYYIGYTLIRFDDFETAYSFLKQSLSEFRTLKDPYWEAVTQFEVLWVLSATGEEAFNEKLLPEIERARKVGERFHLADVLQHRAQLAWDEHQVEEAEAYLREAEILYEELGFRAHPSFLLRGWIALLRNDFQQARAVFTRIREHYNLLDEKNSKSFAIGNLGILAREEGYFDQAQSYFEEALEIQREVGFEGAIGATLMLLGHVDVLRGHPQAARNKFREGPFHCKDYK